MISPVQTVPSLCFSSLHRKVPLSHLKSRYLSISSSMPDLRSIASSPAVSDLLDDADSAGPLHEESSPAAVAAAAAAKQTEKKEGFDPSAPVTFEVIRSFHILLGDGTYYTIRSNQIPIPAEELQTALADKKRPLLGYWNLKQLIRADIVESAPDTAIAAVSSEGSAGKLGTE